MAADLHLPWGWGFLRGIVGCLGVLALWACSHKPPVAQVADAGRMPLGAARPQLTEAQALQYTVTNYLAQAGQLTGPQGQGLVADGWAPAALGDASAFGPHFVVAADGSGSHRTVQAAVDAVPSRSATDRRYYIEVRPGTTTTLAIMLDGELLGQDTLQLSDDGKEHQVLVTCPVKAHQPPLPGYDRSVEADLER